MSYRMARSPSINHLFWIIVITLLHVVSAAPRMLPDDIYFYVPPCALSCIQSFVASNFEEAASASLQSLCSFKGATGFTLGEGAVQCLVAARAVGYCSTSDASDNVIDGAYYMCYGQINAAVPTHSVITATLAVPQFGSGSATPSATSSSHFPTLVPAIVAPTPSAPPPTSLILDTSPSPSVTPSQHTVVPTSAASSASRPQTLDARTSATTLATSARTGVLGAQTSTGTGTPVAGAGGNDEKQKMSPNSGQVAGIAIGVLAGVAIVGGALALSLRYLRRKSFHRWTAASEDSPSREPKGHPAEKAPGRGGTTDSWITNQLRAPIVAVQSPSRLYNRTSWRPSAIGLAISPASQDVSRTTTPTAVRPLSRLLPAKPIMGGAGSRKESAESQEHLMAGGAAVAVAPSSSSGSTPAPDSLRSSSSGGGSSQDVLARSLTGRDKPHPPLPRLQIQIPPSRGSKVVPAPEGAAAAPEDEERASVSPSGGRIWRPRSLDPLTATTYYVADKNGNWVLGDPNRSAEVHGPPSADPKSAIQPKLAVPVGPAAKPLKKDRSDEEAVEKSQGEGGSAKKQRPKTAVYFGGAIDPMDRHLQASRSTSTIRVVDPSDVSSTEDEGAEQPFAAPRPLINDDNNKHSTMNAQASGSGSSSGSGKKERERPHSHKRNGSRSLTHPRNASSASDATSFSGVSEDSSGEGGGLTAPPKRRIELSPVAESLASAASAQPLWVAAPPSRPPAGTATASPPARGGAAAAAPLPAPARQPLGAGTMSSYNRSRQPQRAMGPRPMDQPPDDRAHLPSALSGQPHLPPHPSAYRPARPQPPFNPPDLQRSPSSFQSQLHQQPGAGGGPYPPHPRPAPAPSLLAKRLGPDRAANMALHSTPQPSPAHPDWHRQKRESQQQ